MDLFGWSVNYWSVFCTFFGDRYLHNQNFQAIVFYNFWLHLMRSFDHRQKKYSYFEKFFSLTVKMMTSRFGEWAWSKFYHPQFSSILASENLIETKKLLLASIGKWEEIRAYIILIISRSP